MPQISLRDVGKRYGRGRPAVDSLNVDLPNGSFTAILGPSGCGKTTTLRMLAGLEQPTAGTITVGDRVFSSAESGVFLPTHRRELGFVFQNYALWPHLNVSENVEFGLAVKQVGRTERRRQAAEMLELLRVGHLAGRLPSQLSGGEQQRVAIARALAPRPSLVLFDEPFSNLDAPLRLELSAELKRIHRELEMTAVLVTHDQAEAMAVATELIVMRDGSVEQIGTPVEVYRTPASVHVARFIGSPQMNLFVPDGPFTSLRDATSAVQGVAVATVELLGVRPEHIALEGGTEDWRRAAVVDSVLTMGASAIVHLRLENGTMVTALVRGDSPPILGETTEIFIALERVHLFDLDGRRLGTQPTIDVLGGRFEARGTALR